MAPSLRSKFSLVASNLLLPIALLTFASGFFPYKPVLPGLAKHEDQVGTELTLEAPFERVIFMVVDALRSDFVYGHNSGFTYTQSLVRDGAAIPYTAHATPPTVTMPRVKALTTGSVPSFLDFILNFAESDTSSSLASQDTWLAQLRARPNGKLVFYGDDTWLKLFPDENFFVRHDGTSSFFVSDFTEVDNNVTRHLPEELARSDWNGMIMHYLGLDHIGHKTGPAGPSMLPKQEEMDKIVKLIVETMQNEAHHRKTLLVVAGDHGMNAGGNHGGSGPGETEPALLFVSPQFTLAGSKQRFECPTVPKHGTEFHFYHKVEQSDLVPTLSLLLGLPIPKNSLGVVLEDVLHLWPASTWTGLLRQNAAQIVAILESTYGKDEFEQDLLSFTAISDCADTSTDRQMLACKLVKANACNGEDCKEAYYSFLYSAQQTMSSTASSYNLMHMACGIAIAFGSLSLALLANTAILRPGLGSVFLGIVSLLYGIMMFASSYVEEEQHFWYWLTPAWLVLLGLNTIMTYSGNEISWKKLRPMVACLAIIAIHRLSIRWNQTGQKHAGEADIVHTVFPHHARTMWLLVLATYIFIGYRVSAVCLDDLIPQELELPISLITIMSAVMFKLNFTQADAPELVQDLAAQLRSWTASVSLVSQARIVFMLQGLVCLLTSVLAVRQYIGSKRRTMAGSQDVLHASLASRLQPLLTLFLATQTRAPNVPLILLMDIQAKLLQVVLDAQARTVHNAGRSSRAGRTTKLAVSCLLFAHTGYFCFCGSNSISSLDLSNAYNGVAEYNIVAVGVLLFASNWTAPVWWTFTCLSSMLREHDTSRTRGSEDKANKQSWIQEEHKALHAAAATASKVQRAQHRPSTFVLWQHFVTITTIFVATSCVAVMVACTVLRTHLFVWTVFSPKYLYTIAWTLGWHILLNCLLGGMLQLLAIVKA